MSEAGRSPGAGALLPALAGPQPPALWPFDGALLPLLAGGRVVLAETYPAEAMRQLGLRMGGSKRRHADRVALAPALRRSMAALSARRALVTGMRAFPFRDWRQLEGFPSVPGFNPVWDYQPLLMEVTRAAGGGGNGGGGNSGGGGRGQFGGGQPQQQQVAEEPWGTPASSGGNSGGGDGGWSNPGNFNDETPF